jgi:hypothetical protein
MKIAHCTESQNFAEEDETRRLHKIIEDVSNQANDLNINQTLDRGASFVPRGTGNQIVALEAW